MAKFSNKTSFLLGFFFLFFCSSGLLWAQPVSEVKSMEDASPYLLTLEQTKELSLEKQIKAWQQFLEDHPNTSFREEIENNLKQLNTLLVETDPEQKKEKLDSEKYMKAVAFAKKLSVIDQVALWEQFIEENPQSLYRREALIQLQRLRSRLPSSPVPQTTPTPEIKVESQPPETPKPVAPRLAYKDPQKATLLATFVGPLVPGIGHWYSQEYVMAGILTAGRVGGIALGIPAIQQNNQSMIIGASLLVGFSYFMDVIGAPFAAQRFNESLEKKSRSASLVLNPFELRISMAF